MWIDAAASWSLSTTPVLQQLAAERSSLAHKVSKLQVAPLQPPELVA